MVSRPVAGQAQHQKFAQPDLICKHASVFLSGQSQHSITVRRQNTFATSLDRNRPGFPSVFFRSPCGPVYRSLSVIAGDHRLVALILHVL